MRIIGMLLLLVGLLLLAGGVGMLVRSEGRSGGLDSWACRQAEEKGRSAAQKVRQWEAARGTPDEARLRVEADNELRMARTFDEACANGRAWDSRRRTVFSSVAGGGLLLSIAGFFIWRKKRTA